MDRRVFAGTIAGLIGLATGAGAEAGKRRGLCRRCGATKRCKRAYTCCGQCVPFGTNCCNNVAYADCPNGQNFQCIAGNGVCVNHGGHKFDAEAYCG